MNLCTAAEDGEGSTLYGCNTCLVERQHHQTLITCRNLLMEAHCLGLHKYTTLHLSADPTTAVQHMYCDNNSVHILDCTIYTATHQLSGAFPRMITDIEQKKEDKACNACTEVRSCGACTWPALHCTQYFVLIRADSECAVLETTCPLMSFDRWHLRW